MLFFLNIRTQTVGAFVADAITPATYIVQTVDHLAEWPAVDCLPV